MASHSPSGLRHLVLLTLLPILAGVADAPAQKVRSVRNYGFPQIEDPAEAVRFWQQFRSRPSFWKRFTGCYVLANTRSPEALGSLLLEYAKPHDPVEETRAMVAGMIHKYFQGNEHWPVLAAARSDYEDGEEHMFLWYQTLWIQSRHQDRAGVHALARDPKAPVLHRAAALEALAATGARTSWDDDVALTVAAVMGDLPRKDHEATILTESSLRLLATYSGSRDRQSYRDMLVPFLDRLGDRRQELRHKIVMSRSLGGIFGVDNLGISPEPWQPLVDGKPVSMAVGGGRKTSGTRADFFGINTISQRIVYVIDASDSMLEPVDNKAELLKPVTGGGSATPSGPRKTPEEIALELALPWDDIHNRFDAAIAFVELSLRRLTKEQSFAIVLFGNDAATLQATPSMIPASKGNIAKAIAEMRAIEIGPAEADRPHGTLRGLTNLHGGVRLAFKLQDKKRPLTRGADVDEDGWERGCDTIFVMSDGDPTADGCDICPGFEASDPWDQAGDPESRTAHEMHPNLLFQGPFSTPEYLLVDLERLNLLRKVHLHAVGFGDVQRSFLERMARLGDGRALKLGI